MRLNEIVDVKQLEKYMNGGGTIILRQDAKDSTLSVIGSCKFADCYYVYHGDNKWEFFCSMPYIGTDLHRTVLTNDRDFETLLSSLRELRCTLYAHYN